MEIPGVLLDLIPVGAIVGKPENAIVGVGYEGSAQDSANDTLRLDIVRL